MTRPVQAYLIGGPAHGDVKLIDRPHESIRVPLLERPQYVSYESRLSETAISLGHYRRERDSLIADTHGAQCVLYVWAGTA